MSAESIRAIDAHLKTRTRRPIKPQPFIANSPEGFVWEWKQTEPRQTYGNLSALKAELVARCPYGQPGDALRVKEGFYVQAGFDWPLTQPQPIEYAADVPDRRQVEDYRYVSARFMPRWASRFTLPLVEVRAERLWDITRDGALAEGVETLPWYADSPLAAYMAWWGRIYGTNYSIGPNPWVWVLRWA
jgi:hypothetical protein